MAKGVMQSCASTRHEAAPVPCVRDGTAQFATPSRSSSGPVRVKCLSVSIADTPFLHDPRAKELGGGPDSMTSRDTRGNSIGNGGFQKVLAEVEVHHQGMHPTCRDSCFCKYDKTQYPHCGNKAWIASSNSQHKKWKLGARRSARCVW